ncbi:probable C-mannosyltransferase DPY19L1 [Mytilus californianus]|uniref:probable C-mannosyltransferase DPY19L1 n=1 Tax=Mytilus californianus TaxID=6549 RepID=UPI002247DE9F|nr:probable C-mannosyltransferase DPY19L1 [Mytilus californianus]
MAARKRNQLIQNSNNANQTHSGKKKLAKKSDFKDKITCDSENALNFTPTTKAITLILAIVITVIHRNHVYGMFERERHFSHLSNLERELAFRTEMGLYYSYYKTIITAPTVVLGLYSVMYDNMTEYPLTINVLKRFNLYPEVALGIIYRTYSSFCQTFGIKNKMCWTVNRGKDLSPVQSCEGLGEPTYFYVEVVFWFSGIMMGTLFLFGTFLSGSPYGGILTVLSFFYNHGEATRVMWTPPLRESFAFPVLVIQIFLVTICLRMRNPGYKHSAFISIATVSFMLPWQFAQFALLTQTVAVFGTYVLGYTDSHKIKVILYGQLIGLLVSYLALFGNEMLLTSFFASCLLTVLIIVYLEPVLENIRFRTIIIAIQGILLIIGTVGCKIIVSKILETADDAHIGEIFRSKFGDFKNFHTMLYTCAKEFDFMEPETPVKLSRTLLLPTVFIVVCSVVFKLLTEEYLAWKSPSSYEMQVDRNMRLKPNAEIVYNLLQCAAFTLMAIMIMRLKLFMTPHLCLISSLLASKKIFGWIGSREKQLGLVTIIAAGMTYQGITNLQHQWSIMGEYSNVPLEELVDWINAKTSKNAVFAGPMPTMATVKLTTLRPIVNHPHYEDAGLRERTKKVYSMYSRKPAEELKRLMKEMKVNYVILEDSWCNRRSKPGCQMAEIWDLEDRKNRGKEPLCSILQRDPKPYFKTVFKNAVYSVLKLI